MTLDPNKLIEELIEKTKDNLNQIDVFDQLPIEKLNYRASQKEWSILECLAHLNIYGDYYIPEIETRMSQSSHQSNNTFKTGLLGNYFVKLIQPKEQLNKMKTMDAFNPIGSKLDKTIIQKFRIQQIKMLSLLDKAKNLNLTKIKTGISISKFIKLRLGDTLRFVVLHNQRHIIQANNILFLETQNS